MIESDICTLFKKKLLGQVDYVLLKLYKIQNQQNLQQVIDLVGRSGVVDKFLISLTYIASINATI
jgi:hypothetical protein